MGIALLIIYAIIALISPPVLVVFIVLFIKRGKEIKRLKTYINSIQLPKAPSPVVIPKQEPLPVSKPAPVVKPKPAPAQVEQKPKSKGISSINITFGVGVLLLTVVGAFFITASWSFMSAPVRCGVLLFVAVMVFGLSVLAGQVLKLTQTGFSFFSLGTFLLPIIIFGIGGMGLFESGFTIKDNPGLVGAVAFLCFGVAGFIGSRVYKSNFHMGIAYFGLTWMLLFVTNQIFKTSFSAPFITVGSIAVLALLADKIKPGIKGMRIYSVVMTFCSVLSVVTLCDNEEYGAIVSVLLSTVSFVLLYKFRWKVIRHFLSPMMLLTVLSGYLMVLHPATPGSGAIMIYFFTGSVVTYVLIELLKARTVTSDIVIWTILVISEISQDETDKIGLIILSILMMVAASAIMIRGVVISKTHIAVRYVEAIFTAISIPMIAFCLNAGNARIITFVVLALAMSCLCLVIDFIPGIKRDGPTKLISYITVFEAGIVALSYSLIDFGEALAVTLSIMLMVSLILGILNSQKSRKDAQISYAKTNPVFIALGSMLTLCVPLLVENIIYYLHLGSSSSTLFISVVCGIYILVTIISWIMVKSGNKRFKKYYSVFEMILTFETGVVLFGSLGFDQYWTVLITSVIFIGVLYLIRDTRTALLPSIAIFVSGIDYLGTNNYTDTDKMVIALIIAAVFMISGHVLSYKKLFSGNIFDWLSLSSVMFIFYSVQRDVKSCWSLFFIALAIYFANILRKEKKGFDRFALSLTAICAGMALAVEDIIEIPEIIYTEYLLVIMLLVVFILRTVIKPFGKTAMRYIWLGFFALALFVEATSAAITSEISDLLVVGVTAIGVFIYSFIRKEKAWFVLAMVTLCGIAVYLAATFGNTWTWLIYLFVAGTILITIAMINEYGKRKAEKSGETAKKRLFSEWTW